MLRSVPSLTETLAQVSLERERLRVENARLRRPLEEMADADNWAGNPLSLDCYMYGHDSPYELAQAALADVEQL